MMWEWVRLDDIQEVITTLLFSTMNYFYVFEKKHDWNSENDYESSFSLIYLKIFQIFFFFLIVKWKNLNYCIKCPNFNQTTNRIRKFQMSKQLGISEECDCVKKMIIYK